MCPTFKMNKYGFIKCCAINFIILCSFFWQGGPVQDNAVDCGPLMLAVAEKLAGQTQRGASFEASVIRKKIVLNIIQNAIVLPL